MPERPFESLRKHPFIALSTYRKSGATVTTPVWFIHQDNQLYVWTGKSSGKVKRLKNNPSVRLAASDFRGSPVGDWVDATAAVFDLDEKPQIMELLRIKYGLQFRLFSNLSQRRGGENVFLAIEKPEV